MDDEAVTYNMWCIQHAMFQLCKDRGYLVKQEDLDITFKGFKQIFGNKPSKMNPKREDLNLVVMHGTDPTMRLMVFFADGEVGIPAIRTFYTQMREANIRRAIIVGQEGITADAHHMLVTVAPNYILEYYEEEKILDNIAESQMVPDR